MDPTEVVGYGVLQRGSIANETVYCVRCSEEVCTTGPDGYLRWPNGDTEDPISREDAQDFDCGRCHKPLASMANRLAVEHL